MIPYSFSRVINKTTSEIGVICSTTYGSVCYHLIFWPNRKIFEKKNLQDFDKDYKILDKENTIKGIKVEHIISFLEETNNFGIIDIINRRRTSGYYTPGSLVFFTKPGYIKYNEEAFGPEYPYIIIKNIITDEENFRFRIELAKYDSKKGTDVSKYNGCGDIGIDSFLTLYLKEDCYSLLSRYDTEF